ncbi:MAG: flagellar hook-length control protein FliK [Spirochaetales bacterium]|nr:flagellar hook-length control protein FliK [Spirochaetales bacterium]
MNTAPLQLLPIDCGSKHQEKVSQQMKGEEHGKRFNDVLESAVQKNERKPASREVRTETGKSSADYRGEADSDVIGRQADAAGRDTQTEDGKAERGKADSKADSGKNEKTRKSGGRKTDEITADTKKPKGKGEDVLAAVFAGRAELGKLEDQKASKDLKAGKEAVKSIPVKNILKFNTLEGLKGAAGQSETLNHKLDLEKTGSKQKSDKNAEAKTVGAGGMLSSDAAEKLLRAAGSGRGLIPKAASHGGINSVSKVTGGKASALDGKAAKANSKLRVVDHRRNSAAHSEGKSFKLNSDESFKISGTSADDTGKTIELNAAPDSSRMEGRTAQPRTVQATVLSQLKEGVNDQIVKQAGIIVKANGNGEIKLVMKPEQLGKVRIQLSLNDNHIAGRIIVENNIVREIFESNLENLYKAFGLEGFENGGLEVMVQGGDSDGPGKRSSGGANRRAMQAIEDAVPEIVETEWQNNAVNMVV